MGGPGFKYMSPYSMSVKSGRGMEGFEKKVLRGQMSRYSVEVAV